mgnify:FL=1
MFASPLPQLAWAVGFSNEVLARFARYDGGASSQVGEMVLLALQIRIAQSATMLTCARVLQERGLAVAAADGMVAADGFSDLVERASIVFEHDQLAEVLDQLTHRDAHDVSRLEHLAPSPLMPTSVVLAGAGSRCAQIVTLAGFLARAVTVHGAVDGAIEAMLAADRAQIRIVAGPCRDL